MHVNACDGSEFLKVLGHHIWRVILFCHRDMDAVGVYYPGPSVPHLAARDKCLCHKCMLRKPDVHFATHDR